MADLVVERAPLLDKVRAVLRAGGRRCEIAAPPVPPTGEQSPKVPYTIIDGIDGGGEFEGTLDVPDGCATMIVQLTHVARNGYDANRQADECRRILLGRAAGVYLRSLDSASQYVRGRSTHGPGSEDNEGILVSLPERYEFFVSI